VNVPVPRDTILSPTIIDPKTGEEVPNPYYNKKRGDEPGGSTPHPPPYSGQGF
jgi:hypothetical protein